MPNRRPIRDPKRRARPNSQRGMAALTGAYLSAGAAAGGLALIRSLGNPGPSVSPSINGFIVK